MGWAPIVRTAACRVALVALLASCEGPSSRVADGDAGVAHDDAGGASATDAEDPAVCELGIEERTLDAEGRLRDPVPPTRPFAESECVYVYRRVVAPREGRYLLRLLTHAAGVAGMAAGPSCGTVTDYGDQYYDPDAVRIWTPRLRSGASFVVRVRRCYGAHIELAIDPEATLPSGEHCVHGACLPWLSCSRMRDEYTRYVSRCTLAGRDGLPCREEPGARSCDPGYACVSYNFVDRCVPVVAPHQGCTLGNEVCPEGFTCQGTCEADPGTAYGPCLDADPPCHGDLRCSYRYVSESHPRYWCEAPERTATPPPPSRRPCAPDAPCDAGWWCERGLCAPDDRCPAAAPCGVNSSCDPALGRCVADGERDGRCRETAEPCDPGLSCLPGGSAAPLEVPRCVATAALGEPCERARCAPGLVCAAASPRTCQRPGGAGDACREALPSCDDDAPCWRSSTGLGAPRTCDAARGAVTQADASAWIDACEGGRRGPVSWSERVAAPWELPFAVTVGRARSSRLWIYADGHLDVGEAPRSNLQELFPPPGLRRHASGVVVAPLWTSMAPRGPTSAVCARVVGAPGARVAVVSWVDVRPSSLSSARISMQAQLHERDGALTFVYQTADRGEGSAWPAQSLVGAVDLWGASTGWDLGPDAPRSDLSVTLRPSRTAW